VRRAGLGHRLKSATRREVFTYLQYVEIHPAKAPGLVPVGALRSGDTVTDVNGGGQHYIVLESKTLSEGCVVLELESKANDRLRVIEASFPADYVMSLTPRHQIL
jgi:hypothetical protein